MTYFYIIFEFLKMGLFVVGGGLASIPFLYDLADRYTWFTKEMLVNMIAISEAFPGPLGINMATYAGFSAGGTEGGILAGVAGGIIASLAFVFPSIIIMSFVTNAYDKFKNNKYVNNAFYGLRPAVLALITAAAFEIFRIALVDNDLLQQRDSFFDFAFVLNNFFELFRPASIIIFIVIFFLIRKLDYHPVFYIAICAIVGLILRL